MITKLQILLQNTSRKYEGCQTSLYDEESFRGVSIEGCSAPSPGIIVTEAMIRGECDANLEPFSALLLEPFRRTANCNLDFNQNICNLC
jgi:hypothetical protein